MKWNSLSNISGFQWHKDNQFFIAFAQKIDKNIWHTYKEKFFDLLKNREKIKYSNYEKYKTGIFRYFKLISNHTHAHTHTYILSTKKVVDDIEYISTKLQIQITC